MERYFRGRPYDEELFEHVMDNLYALEDPEIIDDRTVIGVLLLMLNLELGTWNLEVNDIFDLTETLFLDLTFSWIQKPGCHEMSFCSKSFPCS